MDRNGRWSNVRAVSSVMKIFAPPSTNVLIIGYCMSERVRLMQPPFYQLASRPDVLSFPLATSWPISPWSPCANSRPTLHAPDGRHRAGVRLLSVGLCAASFLRCAVPVSSQPTARLSSTSAQAGDRASADCRSASLRVGTAWNRAAGLWLVARASRQGSLRRGPLRPTSRYRWWFSIFSVLSPDTFKQCQLSTLFIHSL